MKRKWLAIGISTVSVIILILTSFTNVIGYQTVQTQQQNVIKEKINQRELLFQTICDIANNKEIQRIILKSQMSRGIFPESKIPIITKNQLKRMYFIGLILSKFISKTRIQSRINAYHLITPDIQQEINAIIEKNPIIKDEITQLVNSECGCETSEWGFPIICTTLLVMMGVVLFFFLLLVLLLSAPPSAIDELLDLLVLMLGPLPALYQRFNCPVPQGNDFPVASDFSPAEGEQNVSLSLSELSFQLTDHEGDLMSYKVSTRPDIGGGSGTLVGNGTYTIPIHGLQNGTTYLWLVLVYQGKPTGTPVGRERAFTTETLFPLIRNPSPGQNAQFVPISTSNVSFDLTDYQGDLMNWTVETQPNIGSGTGISVGNGRYTVPISGLDYFTTYTWFVNATDGRYWGNKTFTFWTTTEKTLVLEPTDDATISEVSPNSNAGTSDPIDIRSHLSGTWLELDGLIKYNISTLPSNATIQYASLQLYYFHSADGNPGGHQVNAYRVISDWDEGTVTWNTQPSNDPEPSSLAIVPSTLNTWVFWNLTGDIQLFYHGGAPNYGWRMVDTSGSQECSCYHSKEYSEYHPLLIIGYK
jgi:hypothetical protein